MKCSLLLIVCILLGGCGATTPLVVLDVDQRLLDRCHKTLPELASSSDTDNLEWSKTMLGLYAKCAKKHDSLATVIEEYNEKVMRATKDLGTSGTERSK
jgi:hypothetical protein